MQFQAKSFVYSRVILYYDSYEFDNERITFVSAAKASEKTFLIQMLIRKMKK